MMYSIELCFLYNHYNLRKMTSGSTYGVYLAEEEIDYIMRSVLIDWGPVKCRI